MSFLNCMPLAPVNAPINSVDFNFNNPMWANFKFNSGTASSSSASVTPVAPAVTEEELIQAEKKGTELFGILDGRTKDEKYADVVNSLKGQNKDTIIRFLDGFYSSSKKEGIIEILDDENDNGSKKKDGLISKDAKLNVIKSLIDYVTQKGYHNNSSIAPALLALNSYYEAYTVGQYRDCCSFNNKTKKSNIDLSKVPSANEMKKDDKAIDVLIKQVYDGIKKVGDATSLSAIA